MTILILLYFLSAILLTLYGINSHVMIHLFKRRSCSDGAGKTVWPFPISMGARSR